jgi:hypothetical protein
MANDSTSSSAKINYSKIDNQMGYVLNAPASKIPELHTEEYDIEIRSFGARVVVLVNDRVVRTLDLPLLAGRGLAAQSRPGSRNTFASFKNLEWRPLTPEGEPLF